MSATNMIIPIEDVTEGLVGIEVDWTFVRDFFSDEFLFDPDDRYMIVMCKCRMCEHEHMSMYPLNTFDPDCQECPNCEHMTCEPVTDDVIVVNA